MNWSRTLLACLPSGLTDVLRGRRRRQRLHAERVAFYRSFLEPGDLVFDVGANIGERVAALLEVGCRVVAVEPQAACIERLGRLPTAAGHLVVVPKACGSAPGRLELRSGRGADVLATLSEDYIRVVGESGRFAGHRWDRVESVEVCTLDALVAEHGMPRFIKIDVEGYEDRVLAGLSASPGMLSFEYTPELAAGMRECVKRCEALGLEEFNVSFGESMVFARQGWIGAAGILGIISALEGDRWLFGDIFARTCRGPRQ